MKVEILIRAATAEDVDEVVALERGVAEAPHWNRVEYEAMVSPERTSLAETPTGEQGGVRRCLLVAEIEGRLAGFAVGKVVAAAESAELESVAVLPSARRMGVGMQLCREVLRWCREQGAARMELEVRARSVGAKRLYERLGFVVEGVRRGYYTEPADDAALMRLDLKNCG